jgi:hypothetical protein
MRANRIASEQSCGGLTVKPSVVDEVDNREHRLHAPGQLISLRHEVRDPRGLDLALGTREPLRHRRLRNQE